MATAAMEPSLPGRTFSDLVRDTLRALFLPEEQGGEDSADKRAAQLRNDPFYTRLTELVQPVQEAPNPRSLRQILARIGLSQALASFDIESGASLELTPELFDQLPPAPPHATARLGAEATALLIEALKLNQPAMQVLLKRGLLKDQQDASQHLGPQALASRRHKLVLGDMLPPSVAEVVLANLRGQVALIALFQAALDIRRTPEWKAVALGEIAVEGMKALQRLVLPGSNHIDIGAAAEEHARRKEELFARLEAEASSETPKAEVP